MRLLGLTLRIEKSGVENIAKARLLSGNLIYAVWHGRLLLLTYVHRNEGIDVLVSTHQDGEYIARVITGLGFGTVRGSSTRGGTGAVFRLTGAGAGRHDIGITPDGPGGPREVCQPGVVYLAKRNRMPVVPIGASHRPSVLLSSWDRFMVPLPFARCAVVYGEPVLYDSSMSEESIEDATRDLEKRIRTVTQEADNGCGRTTE
ncbi:MAG: lysophospholipid acyltransferase family protein [Candidatus Eisenbacteria bacterium]